MEVRSAWTIQKSVVMALTLRELKTRFGANRLGYVWVLLEPALHTVMLVIVFSFIRNRVQPGVEFPVWLIVGLIPYLLFKNIALRTMGSIQANQALFAYRQIKPMDAMVSRVIFESILMAFVYAATLGFMALLGYHVIPAYPLELLGIHLLAVLAGFGFGTLLSILIHAMPESAVAIRIFFMPLYFMSGVIFPLSHVPAVLVPFLLWNPVLHFVELARATFFENYQLSPEISVSYAVVFSFFCVYVGIQLYHLRRFRLTQR